MFSKLFSLKQRVKKWKMKRIYKTFQCLYWVDHFPSHQNYQLIIILVLQTYNRLNPNQPPSQHQAKKKTLIVTHLN